MRNILTLLFLIKRVFSSTVGYDIILRIITILTTISFRCHGNYRYTCIQICQIYGFCNLRM